MMRRFCALALAGCMLAGAACAAGTGDAPASAPAAANAAVPAAVAPAPAPAVTAGVPPPVFSPAPDPALAADSAPTVRPLPGRPSAPAPAPGYTPPSAGGLLQTIFALTLVLGLLFGLAWVMKRFGPRMQGGSGGLRIAGSLNLGGRERIMLVEVGDQWIVVGASPGRINALATMPKQEGAPLEARLEGHSPAASSFSDWLKQTIDKRNAK